MNPFEYLDTLEKIQLKKIQDDNKQNYTKEEVMKLLKKTSIGFRKAIYNGEYILNLDILQKDNIIVNDTEFAIQKLITEDNKYLLFIQVTDIIDETFTDKDFDVMVNEIQKAIKKTNNVVGVVLLPSNMEISLVTAKLETLSYAKSLEFTEEDLKTISDLGFVEPDDNGIMDYRPVILEDMINQGINTSIIPIEQWEVKQDNSTSSVSNISKRNILDTYYDYKG